MDFFTFIIFIFFGSIMAITLYNQYKFNKRMSLVVIKEQKRLALYNHYMANVSFGSIKSDSEDYDKIMDLDSSYYQTENYH